MYPNLAALRLETLPSEGFAAALADLQKTHNVPLADLFYTLADANVQDFAAATEEVRALSRDLSLSSVTPQ